MTKAAFWTKAQSLVLFIHLIIPFLTAWQHDSKNHFAVLFGHYEVVMTCVEMKTNYFIILLKCE